MNKNQKYSYDYSMLDNNSDNIFTDILNTKEQINSSNECSEKVKNVLCKIIDICYNNDKRYQTVNTTHITNLLDKSFGKNIISFKERIYMDKTDIAILQHYQCKLDILGIYKYDNNIEREYWLVMDSIYSSSAMECYDRYFDILNETENNFVLRIINKKDLKALRYLNPIKLYEMEG